MKEVEKQILEHLKAIRDILEANGGVQYLSMFIMEDGEIDYVSDSDKEIARLTAENQRLREEAAEQKSIAAHEHATQMEWFRIACDYKAKNAIELPCVKAVKTKEWIDKVEVGDTIWEWAVVYIDRQGEFVVEPCRSKTAAEARLKELKENNND